MSDSLRDQLLGLGFKPAPKTTPKPAAKPEVRTPPKSKTTAVWNRGRSAEEIELAKAYALRAEREKNERLEAERQKQEVARVRREARAKLDALLEGKGLNDAAADIARHFPYGGKIKRIRVTADQLAALNAGTLGVVQRNGRYLLVDAMVLAEAETIFPEAVALKVDPNAPAVDEAYEDSQFQVPDDLVW